jgi:hypothetical protein
MDKKTFDREIQMCQKLNRENGGHCNWGECKKCGVIPLLHKLHHNKFYEKAQEIKNLKNKTFSN